MHTRRVRRRAYNEPGHVHELTFLCYRRYPFVQAERVCRWLADAIDVARVRLDFGLWAYVFMPEHVHLLAAPRRPETTVAAILKAIKGPVGRRAIAHLAEHAPHWLTRLTRRRGTKVERLFWQSGGGYDRNIWSPRALRAAIDYVHANPIRRGLVARPADWRWSSAGWFEGDSCSCLVPDRLPPEWSEVAAPD